MNGMFLIFCLCQQLPWVIWIPPQSNRVKLSFDGSYNPFTQAECIGIIRGPACTLIAASSGKVRAEHSLGAELAALLKGVELCLELDHWRGLLDSHEFFEQERYSLL